MEMVLMIAVCIGMMMSSHASFDHIKIANKKINQKGVYQRYQRYSVISMIHPDYLNLADQIEKFMQTSSFRRSYSALPAETFHITVYAIPNRRKLNAKELDDRNRKAMCNLERYQSELLYINYASLIMDKSTISIRVELEPNNLQMIRNGFATVYGNPMPKADKCHITLAYVYGKIEHIDMNDWNYLNWLVGQYNGASLLPPKVFECESMNEYFEFQHNCRSRP